MDQRTTGKNGLAGEQVDAPEVAILPPTLFLGGLAAGCILELIWPLGPGLAQGTWKPFLTGLFVAGLGLGCGWLSVRRFNEAGTSYAITEPTDTLVTVGLYRVSRNPIYLGLITLYFGIALALTSLWALILLPGLVAVLRNGVIEPEEAFLEDKFGEAFRAYKAKVPRWL
jgi:protein-S-isoprenylcysteine O-methyltransferase Ste14